MREDMFVRSLQSGQQSQDTLDKEADFKDKTIEGEVDFREQATKDGEMLVIFEGTESVGDILNESIRHR